MTKHTPGPWTTVGRAIGGAKVGIARDEHNPLPFASVHGSGSDDGDKVADANARLIASGPDLLAALQDIIEYSKGGTWSPGDRANALRRGEAAIAKARGD